MTDSVDQTQLIWLRFEGEDLDPAAIPIHHLGVSLLALQRIVNKAYLFSAGRLQSRRNLTHRERGKISLQVSAHQQGSDLYGLSPFLLDPIAIGVMSNLLTDALKALAKYIAGTIGESRENEKEESQDLLIVIFRDVLYRTRPLGSFGGIEAIEIIPSAQIEMGFLRFELETKKRIRDLRGRALRGDRQELTGNVVRLYPHRNVLELSRSDGPDVSVSTNQEDFDVVRYECKRDELLTFIGWPIYPLGIERLSYKKFEAQHLRRSRR